MSLMVLENGARWSVDEGWDDDGVMVVRGENIKIF